MACMRRNNEYGNSNAGKDWKLTNIFQNWSKLNYFTTDYEMYNITTMSGAPTYVTTLKKKIM